MPEPRFDLSYEGLILTDADPDVVRSRIGQIFKLNDKGVERLFTGKPVIVKRDVDRDTAMHFERVFARAGAVLTTKLVEPAGLDAEPGSVEVAPVEARDSKFRADPAQGPEGLSTPPTGSGLALAALFGDLEDVPPVAAPDLDTSYLSLVPGDDWTLEDCMPPPTLIPEPDISYLSLVPIEAPPEDEREYGRTSIIADGARLAL
jgi:hypothetical protein